MQEEAQAVSHACAWIDETSPGYVVWGDVRAVLAFFTTVVTTLRIAYFDVGVWRPVHFVEAALDLIFMVDAILQYVVFPRDRNDRPVTDVAKRLAWFKWEHFANMASIWPWEQFGSGAPFSTLTMLGFLRLVRLRHVAGASERASKSIHVSPITVALARFIVTTFLVGHSAGCVFYLLARKHGFGDHTWVGRFTCEDRDGCLDQRPVHERYLESISWSYITLTTVGYGDVYPVSSIEKIFTVFYVVSNVCISTVMLATMTTIIMNHESKLAAFREDSHHLSKYLQENDLPRDLQAKMLSYLRLQFERSGQAQLQASLEARFPSAIKMQVLESRFEKHFRGNAVFGGASKQFLKRVIARAQEGTFLEGMLIVAEGDVAHETFIVLSGTVDLVGNLGEADELAFATLGADAAFGAVAFFTNSQQQWSVRAGSLTTCVSFKDDERGSLGELFPSDYRRILKNLADVAKDQVSMIQTLMRQRAEEHMVANDDVSDWPEANPADDAPAEESADGFSDAPNDDWAPPPAHRQRLSHDASLGSPLLLVGKLSAVDLEGSRRRSAAAAARHRRGPSFFQARAAKRTFPLATAVLYTQRNSRPSPEAERLGASLARCRGTAAELAACLARQQQHLTAVMCDYAARGDVRNVRALLRLLERSDVRLSDYDKRTPLHLAAGHGELETLGVLAAAGLDVNAIDVFGNSPLYEAALKARDKSCVALLRRHGAALGKAGPALAAELCAFATASDAPALEALLLAGASPDLADYDLRTAIHLACAEGNAAIVRLLLDNGADVNLGDRWGSTPLMQAVASNQAHIVRDLVRAPRADLAATNAAGETAMRLALDLGLDDCVAVLRVAGAPHGLSAHEAGSRAIFAALSGDSAALRRLVSAGIPVDACDYDKRTALHLAAAEGNLTVVQELVAFGADVNAVDRWKHDALSEAVDHGHATVAAYLELVLTDRRDKIQDA